MKIPPFLRKLKLIIQTVPEEIAGWNEDGDVFEVIDPKGFRNELSKHFKGTEQTFIRQLHFYGFTKFDCTRNLRKIDRPLPSAKPGAWAFSHPLLLKSSPELIDNIQRQAERKTTLVGNSDSGDESEEGSDQALQAAQNEILKLKQLNKDLNNSIQALRKNVTLLSSFIEEEGYDVDEILSSTNTSSSKKRGRKVSEIVGATVAMPAAPLLEDNQSNSTSMELSREDSMIIEPPLSPEMKRSKIESTEPFEKFDLERQSSIDYFLSATQMLSPSSTIDEDVDLDLMLNQIDSFSSEDKLAENDKSNELGDNDMVMFSSINTLEEDLKENKSNNFEIDAVKAQDTSKIEKEQQQQQQQIFAIDAETVAKVVMHLREALKAAIPKPAEEDKSMSPKTEKLSNSLNTISNSARSGNVSPRKRATRRNSQIIKNSQIVSLTQQPAADVKDIKQFNENSISTLLPKLLALPQIREALSSQGKCAQVESASNVSWFSPSSPLITAL